MLLLAQRSLGTAAVQCVTAVSQTYSAPLGAAGNFVLCFQKNLQSVYGYQKVWKCLMLLGAKPGILSLKQTSLCFVRLLGYMYLNQKFISYANKKLQVSAVLLVLPVLLVSCCVRIIWSFLSCQLNVTQCLQLLCESWVLDNICAMVSAIGTYREVKWAVLFSHFLFFCVYLAYPRGVGLSWKTHSLRQAKGKKMHILQMTF